MLLPENIIVNNMALHPIEVLKTASELLVPVVFMLTAAEEDYRSH